MCVYVYLYIYIYIYIHLSLSIYIYIYIHIHTFGRRRALSAADLQGTVRRSAHIKTEYNKTIIITNIIINTNNNKFSAADLQGTASHTRTVFDDRDANSSYMIDDI